MFFDRHESLIGCRDNYWRYYPHYSYHIYRYYNSLVALRNQVKNSRGQIDTKLTRRYDLLPMLSSSIKRTMGNWRIFNIFAKKK